MRAEYRYWRIRQLYTTFIGYAVFYFVRANFAMAMPGMEKGLHFTKETLGKFLTVGDVIYGVSKFVNGMLADRTNPRFFMAIGLLMSGVLNICLGFATLPLTIGMLLICNGWFQGMGFPPVARVLSHWFSPSERGTMWGLWNTSHQVGGAGILVLGGYLATHLGWQSVFFVPAAIAIVIAGFIMLSLRDTPGSLGLPPVEVFRHEARSTSDVAPPTPSQAVGRGVVHSDETPPTPSNAVGRGLLHGDETPPTPSNAVGRGLRISDREPDAGEFGSILRERVFGNRYIWLVCFANFFVYVVRYVFMKWGPTYLYEAKHIALDQGGWTLAFFEIAGLFGSLLAGWITDRFFSARRAPVCVVYMLATSAVIYGLWCVPAGASPWLVNILIWAVGFFDYGPQFLVGVMMADMATKQAAATAIGLSGFFGYMSGLVSGWGMGYILDHQGWDGAFQLLVVCALAGAACFAACWKATAWHARPDDTP